MKIKIYPLFLFALFMVYQAKAQTIHEDAGQKSVYVEFGGSSLGGSINFDWLMYQKIFARIGVGFFVKDNSDTIPNTPDLFFPPNLNASVGYLFYNYHGHCLELGSGATWLLSEDECPRPPVTNLDCSSIKGVFIVGYRYQGKPSSILYRVSFTPMFDFSNIFLWGGASIGFTF